MRTKLARGGAIRARPVRSRNLDIRDRGGARTQSMLAATECAGHRHGGLAVEAVLFLAGIYYAGTAYADDDIIDIDPSSLTVYYERPEEETRAYIADALLSAYARDRAVLSRKKRRLVVAVRCFLAQIARPAVLLVVTAIVR